MGPLFARCSFPACYAYLPCHYFHAYLALLIQESCASSRDPEYGSPQKLALTQPMWWPFSVLWCSNSMLHQMKSRKVQIPFWILAGPDTMLSRQTLLNCGAYEGMGAGCDGGDVIDVMHYMQKFGLPDESCMTCVLHPPCMP